MQITCPHCNFSREVPDAKVPDRPVRVTCPKCAQGFDFDKRATAAAGAFADDFFAETAGAPSAEPAEAAALTACPACGLEQPAGESCAGCGVIYARWAVRRQGAAAAHAPAAAPAGAAAAATIADRPKAGFWIRVGACFIDSLILGVVQFLIGFALGLAGGALGGGDSDGFVLGLATWLCSTAVSLTYYIFFTGYNGQTPGKMALRIQVVRTDGLPLGYGRAVLREVLGKFVSAIILGIGYLMVAFDRDKQGLHDRIVGTYVIKL